MKIKRLSLYSVLILFFQLITIINAQNKKDIDTKVDSLLNQMTLAEKIGQMTQVDYYGIRNNIADIAKYSIGSILCGGDAELKDISPTGWADTYDKIQTVALSSRLKIPIIWGIDAVHGHNNVDGATIFPHNIGLGATRNFDLVEKIAAITAEEMKGTGLQWAFAPCIAVALDERWGRTYESFSEDPELVRKFSAAYVKGMQGADLSMPSSALACAKHFLGEGGTTNGKDQGNTECDEATLRKIHLPGYIDAIKAGIKSIMVSYSSWNGLKMHANKYLVTDVLKGELKFDGIVISDWAAIDQLGKDYKKDVELSINAGLDMIMIPNGPGKRNNFMKFINNLIKLVNEGKVKRARIDDAVRRILKVKFELGVFEKPFANRELTKTIGSEEHRKVAREAVRQSLVLLKNENKILPIAKEIKRIHLAGKGIDNIGLMCGGWTISWQGKSGKVISGGTTILKAIENTVSNKTKITYSLDGSNAEGADVCFAVVGEKPYAEGRGDRKDLTLSEDDNDVIKNVKKSGVPIVVILLSGRPMIINEALKNSNAFIAAWLPGTEGQGIADVLFGNFKPVGKLSFSWPRNMKQIPINIGDENYDPLFPYGFGLTY